MKVKYLLAAAVLFATACSKDETKTPDPVDPCPNGTIRFTNTSSNPYKIYIDGEFRTTLSGNHHIDYEVKKGSHDLRALQASGYVLYPTEKTVTISIGGCEDKEFIFP